MIATPFNIFAADCRLALTPVASSISFTISSKTSQGGAGVIGWTVQPTLIGIAMAGPGSNTVTPTPVATVLKSGTVGIAYSETITARNGAPPYSFSVSSGSLPSGTTLNSSTGVISGTPLAAATSSFSIRVTDASGFSGDQAFQIIIAVPSAGGGGAFVFIS
jgi:hypothetical protein